MLDRVDRWNAYLSDAVKLDKEELIERHARTGRPLGNPDFIPTFSSIDDQCHFIKQR